MHPSDRQQLEQWLAKARAVDVDELQRQHAAEQQFARAGQVRNLANTIRSAPAKRRSEERARVFAFAVAASVLLVGGFAGWSVSNSSEQAAQIAFADDANLRQVFGKVIATHTNGVAEIVSDSTRVRRGDEISTTAEASASVESGKARLDLSSATTVQLEELGQEAQTFRLKAGRVDVSVAKVPGKRRLVKVTTADSVVTVHGTVFSVEVENGDDGPTTKVAVTRGLVQVQKFGQAFMLHAGMSWDSSTVEPPEQAKVEPDEQVEEKEPEAKAIRNPASGATSSLRQQNRLFSVGLKARDRGDDKAALARFRQLLSKYPDSPLRATVQAEVNAAKKRLQAQEDE
jgi:hypothetical protein